MPGEAFRLTLTSALLLTPLLAQTTSPPGSAQNFQTWIQYEGYHSFRAGRPWGLQVELMNKSNHGIFDEAALAARIGLNYRLRTGDQITGGFALTRHYPYDRVSQPYKWNDYRIWEQYYLRRNYGPKGNQWGLRFRLEQRWLQRNSPSDHSQIAGYQFENTLRIMARHQWQYQPTKYFAVWDELYLRIPPPQAEHLVDQNRFFAGFGFHLSKVSDWRIEIGYQYQATWNSVETVPGRKRVNHCVRITLASDQPFHR